MKHSFVAQLHLNLLKGCGRHVNVDSLFGLWHKIDVGQPISLQDEDWIIRKNVFYVTNKKKLLTIS
jgi:hypothetical protein